jgi:CSLREA domain-containing protein
MRQQAVIAKRTRGRALRASALALALSGLFAASASAATIDVNTTTDEYLSGAGCSLREAIDAANTDAAQGGCTTGESGAQDTINVPSGIYMLTRGAPPEDTDFSGDLDVLSGHGPVLIQHTGSGQAVIDASGLGANPDRVLENIGATLTIKNLTLRGGKLTTSGDAGGGIQSAGNLTLDSVTISDNQSLQPAGEGGGLADLSGNDNLVNVTFHGNSADQDGGGIYDAGGSVFLNNVTISGNTADADAGGNPGDGGGISTQGGQVITLQNTIVAGNTDKTPTGGGPDCDSNSLPSIVRSGYDLIQTLTPLCAFGPGDDSTGFITGQDPLLGPLGDNGGPVLTEALLAGSPAIDAGSPGGGNSCVTTDARGISRPQGPRCDMGAFELQPAGGGGTPATCNGKAATITGTAGADKLKGTKKADVIAALGGNDTVSGLKGNDIICGGAGKDRLIGGPGKDKLFGGAGKDKLSGGPGKDKLVGGPGKDTCNGGAKKDTAKSCEKKAGFP